MNIRSWGGLFYQPPTLSLEQKQELTEMLKCNTPEEVAAYADTIKSVEEDLAELKGGEEHMDQDFIDKAFAHYAKYTNDSTEQEAIDNFIDLRCSNPFTGTGNYEEMRYRPEQFNKKLGPNGGWIMVIEDIPVAEEDKPVLCSVYFAKPDPIYHPFISEETHRRKSKEIKVPYYKVMITIENGNKVWLWPHEYMRIVNIDDILEEVGNSFEIIRLGGDANYDVAKVHYLSTRGIDQAGTYRLMMGAVRSNDFVFFKLLPGKSTEFWHHYIRCLKLGATPQMAIREWEMLEAGITHYPIKLVNSNSDESNNTISKSRKKTNTRSIKSNDKDVKSDGTSG